MGALRWGLSRAGARFHNQFQIVRLHLTGEQPILHPAHQGRLAFRGQIELGRTGAVLVCGIGPSGPCCPLFAEACNAYQPAYPATYLTRMVEHGPGAIAPASATFCNNSLTQFANLPCVLVRRACKSRPKTRLWPCREGFWHDACCEEGVDLESTV